MEDVLKEAPYVVLRNGQWQLWISCHLIRHLQDFEGAPSDAVAKNNIFSILFMDSLGKCWKLLGFQIVMILGTFRSSCRVCEANVEILLELKLIESTKTCFETARKISLLRRRLAIWVWNILGSRKKWSNLSVLCDNSNVPWLGHEILHQILPPCGGAPICPLRKGNTSPEIRLPH